MSNENKAPFFVGYLQTPAALKRFYRVIFPVLLLSGVGVAFAISSAQETDGSGSWDPATTESMEGFLTVSPYPVLHTADGRSVLLVRVGKFSANEIAEAYANQHVSIKGAPIERGGWRMLELSKPDAIQSWTPSANIAPPAVQPGETVTLAGEIVDSKCFLGVMNPGAGKVHRACAAMCLTGGMPPMLVITDAVGDRYGYMLTTTEGTSASQLLVPDVAVPVNVTGTLEQRGDLTYIRLQDNGVQRL